MMINFNKYSFSLQYLLIALIFFCMFSCLARPDYNFVFAFLCYYMWTQKYNEFNATLILIINAALILADIIWLIVMGSIWLSKSEGDVVWNELYGLHGFVFWLGIFELILKAIICYFAYSLKTYFIGHLVDPIVPMAPMSSIPANPISYEYKANLY